MDFDVTDDGSGPVLLFLPGAYSEKSAWKGVLKHLSGSYRVITTSLPGYGASQEVRPQNVTDMTEMSDFVAKVIAHIGAPVHLIGHSYGGLTALAAALHGGVTPLSLVTFEANVVFARPAEAEPDWWPEMLATTQRFEAAVKAKDPEAAAIIIDYWGGPGFFASMPAKVQDFCRKSAAVNLLDWRSASGFRPFFKDFAQLGIPATLVRGALSNPAIVDLTARIADQMPQASLKIVKGAGHFLISTHPADCAAIIDAHMAALRREARNKRSP